MIKVGFTYDLRSEYLKMGYSEEETAEFDREDTVEAIESTLQGLGYLTVRIGNVKQLAAALVNGERWDIVFNICEGMYGIGREAQVPALLDAWNIPYVFSDPLVLSLTLNKAMTKRVIRDAGIPTADFRVVYSAEEASETDLTYPLFAKPLAEGTGKGINGNSVIRSPRELLGVVRELTGKFRQPVLVERFLSGREFTVGITGSGNNASATGTMEITLNDMAEKEVYSYQNKEEYESMVEYSIAEKEITEKCEKLALDAWKILGCQDGGRVDIRCDDEGEPNFIEVNPLAGLHPVNSDLPILSALNGVSYSELLDRIMLSALSKIKTDPKR